MVSACLVGVPCRYHGGHAESQALLEHLEAFQWLPVCPEQMGGLPTPRDPAELRGDAVAVLEGRGRVVTAAGKDVTEAFLRGAEAVLRLARAAKVGRAFLKDRSPSCGVRQVYRDGRLIPGMGVTAALLAREGIRVEPWEETSGGSSAACDPRQSGSLRPRAACREIFTEHR